MLSCSSGNAAGTPSAGRATKTKAGTYPNQVHPTGIFYLTDWGGVTMMSELGKAGISPARPKPASALLPVSQPRRTLKERMKQILLKQWQVIQYQKLKLQPLAKECRNYKRKNQALEQMLSACQRRMQGLEGLVVQTAERNLDLKIQVKQLQKELRALRKDLPGIVD
jgi:hypothetical protein